MQYDLSDEQTRREVEASELMENMFCDAINLLDAHDSEHVEWAAREVAATYGHPELSELLVEVILHDLDEEV